MFNNIPTFATESNTNKQANARTEAAAAARQHIVAGEAVADGRQHDPRVLGVGLHAGVRHRRLHGEEADVG